MIFVMTKLMEIELVMTDIDTDIARIIDDGLDDAECGDDNDDENKIDC